MIKNAHENWEHQTLKLDQTQVRHFRNSANEWLRVLSTPSEFTIVSDVPEFGSKNKLTHLHISAHRPEAIVRR